MAHNPRMAVRTRSDASMLFAERFSSALGAAGYATDLSFAVKLGVSPTTVSNWRAGALPRDPESWRAVCELLSVSADYLLGLTDDPAPRGAAAPAGVPYHQRLTAAARALEGARADFAIMRGFEAREGDERTLEEARGERGLRAALMRELDARKLLSGIDPYELVGNDALVAALEADPAVTVGEACFAADCPRFAGGPDSKLRNSPEFYALVLAALRAAMDGQEPPPLPEEPTKPSDGPGRSRRASR